MTKPEDTDLRAAAEKATPGPWCVEQCGIKEDCPVVGIAYRDDDHDCKNPLSGWLPAYDDEGCEIEYYREPIATEISGCDGASAGANAAYIALANPSRIIPILDERDRLRAERDEAKAAADLMTEQCAKEVEYSNSLRAQCSDAFAMLNRYDAPLTDDANGSALSLANRIEAMVYRDAVRLGVAERDLAAARKPNRDAMANRTEEEWDAIEDATMQVYGLRAGHTLTAEDVAALNLVDRTHRDDDEGATEAHHKGREEGLRERGGDELVELDARHSALVVDVSTQRGLRAFAEARVTALEAEVAGLREAALAVTKRLDDTFPDDADTSGITVKVGLLRALAAALKEPSDGR